MTILGYHVVNAKHYRPKWYWIPTKLTLYINPPIYRWGYWNICRININLNGW